MKIQEIINVLFFEIKAENIHNPEHNTLSFFKNNEYYSIMIFRNNSNKNCYDFIINNNSNYSQVAEFSELIKFVDYKTINKIIEIVNNL